MRDELLGDLPATGGRPNFGADKVPEPDDRGYACEDCGSIGRDLTYYPTEDIHACGPCSNGEHEPSAPYSMTSWDDPRSSPIQDIREAKRFLEGLPRPDRVVVTPEAAGDIERIVNRTKRKGGAE